MHCRGKELLRFALIDYVTVSERAADRPNRADSLPKWPEWYRIGRIQRQVRRAFIASGGKPLTSSELVRRAYPRLRGTLESWCYRAVRC